MRNSNLLASVALFSELYNNDRYQDIGDIIAEFIKAAVVHESKWVMTSTQLTAMLKNIYDFELPESVVRQTLKTKLKNICKREKGNYIFETSIKNNFTAIESQYESIVAVQNTILKALEAFIEEKEGNSLTKEEKDILQDNLTKFLLANGVTDVYSKYISAFVIKNQKNNEFRTNLNLVKEGILLYQGLQYTADISDLGKWNTELNIYLSTEHLFDALGYNGSLFEQIFNDFHCLAKQINSNSKGKFGIPLIRLFYLTETQEAVDSYFHAAENIIRGSRKIEPPKAAMKTILDSCKNASQVAEKKIKFYATLQTLGIQHCEIKSSPYAFPEFVVEGQQLIEDIRIETQKKRLEFNELDSEKILRIFTTINYLRRGQSQSNFEKVGHIFITSKSLALYLAHSWLVKFGNDTIPFAKDLDYITYKFWFKSRKGFHEKSSFPKSLDVVVKSQVILSGLLNLSISHEYDRLSADLQSGVLSEQEALQLTYALREKPRKPEDITVENIDDSLNFLMNESHFEDLKREQDLTKIKYLASLEKIAALEKEAKLRDEADQSARDLIEKEQSLVQQNNYVNERWKQTKRAQLKNVVIFSCVTIIAIIGVALGILIKAIPVLNIWLRSLPFVGEVIVWAIVVLFLSFELWGRSYIFNKESTKAGWIWLRDSCSRTQKRIRKDSYFQQFRDEFLTNPSLKDKIIEAQRA